MAVTTGRIARPQFEKHLVEFLAVFLAYYLAGKIGQATTEIRSSNLGPVWPAYGVALAAVLLRGNRVLPAILLAAFVVALQSPVLPVAAAGQAIAGTLAAWTGGWLLGRANFNLAMERLHDALILIVIGGFTSALVSSLLGTAVLFGTGQQPYTGIGSAWLVYWLGDSTGVLLLTPLVLTGGRLLKIQSPAHVLEFAGIVALAVLTCWMVFGDAPLIPGGLQPLAFAMFPLIMWAAIRFGVSGTSATTLIIAATATVATALGSGPFSQATIFASAVLLDIFFAVLATSGLTLAAVIAEREQAELARERLIRDQAAMEGRLRVAELAAVIAEREQVEVAREGIIRDQAATETRLRVAEVMESSGAALRASEDKLRLILNSAAEAIFGIDMDGRCTFCNQACLRALGYLNEEALLRRDMHQLILHSHADGAARVRSSITDVLESGRGIHVDEDVLWRADGSSFPVEWWCFPLQQGGNVIGAVAGFSDITQRRQAEAHAAALRDELAHLGRVGMLSALTGALAHEINQPLTAVRINAEAGLILLAAEQPALHEIRAALNEIRNDNQRAAEVLHRVRSLLRKEPTRMEPGQTNSIVSDVVKLIENSAVRRGIRLEVALAQRSRPVCGDRIQMQQVVLNLLMNACDAVEQNDRSSRRVDVRTYAGEGGMIVEIRDNGRGLSDDELSRVFEPFYTTKRDGMGLGLSICRSIVDAHGGTLVAARNSDRGMTFLVSFPYWEMSAGDQGRQANSPPAYQ